MEVAIEIILVLGALVLFMVSFSTEYAYAAGKKTIKNIFRC